MKKVLFIAIFCMVTVAPPALQWPLHYYPPHLWGRVARSAGWGLWEKGWGGGSALAYVLDKVEAVVDDHVITMSDLDRAVQVEKEEGSGAGESESELRKAALDSLINRDLLIDEARKFNIVHVSQEEVDQAFKKVRDNYPDEKAFEGSLRKDGITQDELKDNLRDQILVLKYVDRRIRAFVLVTPDEEKKYYEEHKREFGTEDFDAAEPEIKKLLTELETDRKLDRYLKDLRSKANIIINP